MGAHDGATSRWQGDVTFQGRLIRYVASSTPGGGGRRLRCRNGHEASAGQTFCPVCGVPLHPAARTSVGELAAMYARAPDARGGGRRFHPNVVLVWILLLVALIVGVVALVASATSLQG
jgi:hypothetical protein